MQPMWFYWKSNEWKTCPSDRELGVTANDKENAMR
jgi:hypothetical protein